MKKIHGLSISLILLGMTVTASAITYKDPVDINGKWLYAGVMFVEKMNDWAKKNIADVGLLHDFVKNETIPESNNIKVDIERVIQDEENHFFELKKNKGFEYNPNPEELYHFKVTPAQENAPIPEPATLFLLGSGLSGLALWGKRRKAA